MALQHSYISRAGFTATEAYHRISQFMGDKTNIRATIEIHYDVAARRTNKQPIGVEMVNLKIADGATLTQMYVALKALPQYSGAIDEIGVVE